MNLLDNLAKEIYGITKEEALSQNICLQCKKTPTFITVAGEKEYPISGLCEPCFDGITSYSVQDVQGAGVTKEEKDLEYDFRNIASRTAYDEAYADGLEVVVPENNQLQLDIDDGPSYDLFLKNKQRFAEYIMPILYVSEKPSRSGQPEKKHITITLADEVTPSDRILYQLFLGSDRTREFLSYLRCTQGDDVPTLFLEKPDQKLLRAAENLGAY